MKKTINLTNSNIKYYIQTFAREMQTCTAVMDFTLLYNIRKNMQRLEDAIRPYDATVCDIREKYNINSGKASDEDKSNAEREFVALGQVEVPIEIDSIPISMFNGVNCTISFMNSIFFMIDE